MKILNSLTSRDGTGKISIQLQDNSVIESVLLVDQTGRTTACLSSQVGCAQGCTFCQTGNLGLKRNLIVQEITGQFDLLKSAFNKDITNIVYMGMGEPLHNIDNVLESIKIFTNPKTYNIFLRRITISTSGVVSAFPKLLLSKPYPGLAFSLITANRKLREQIIPKTPSLDKIKESLIKYQQVTNKRIIIEIINFKGINETEDEANEIFNFLNGLNTIINLIPYNETGNNNFEAPDLEKVKIFSKHLFNLGLKVTIRHSKGQDIAGACGQLGKH